MRLFQILPRLVATGKIKVTQKLVDRLGGETAGKHSVAPLKPRRRKYHGLVCLCSATIAVLLMLPVGLASLRAATIAQPVAGRTDANSYSAAELYNQANAFARNGKTGPAILNYERARLLAPGDNDIAANLQFVRAKAGLPDAPVSWLGRSLSCVRSNTMAWWGSGGLMLAGLSLLLIRRYPQRRLAFRALASVGALLVTTAIGSAITIRPETNEAIVISRAAPARTSPVSVALPAFKLGEGETVTVLAKHEDFALVKTQTGRSGWVMCADIARVIPQTNTCP